MPQPLHAHAWDEETCTGRRIDAPAHLQSVLDPDRRGRRRAAKSTRSPGPGGGEAWHKSKNGRVVISRPFPNASYRTAQSNHIGDLVVVHSLTYRHPGDGYRGPALPDLTPDQICRLRTVVRSAIPAAGPYSYIMAVHPPALRRGVPAACLRRCESS